MEDVMKIVKSVQNLVYWYKEILKQLKMKRKKYKDWFLSTLISLLGASFLRNLLAGKYVKPERRGSGVIRACHGTVTTSQDF